MTKFIEWLTKLDPEKDWQAIKSLHELEPEVVESIQRLGVVNIEDVFNWSIGIMDYSEAWIPTVVYVDKSLVTKDNRAYLDAKVQELALSNDCTDKYAFLQSKNAAVAYFFNLSDEQFTQLVESKATAEGYVIFEVINNQLVIRNLL